MTMSLFRSAVRCAVAAWACAGALSAAAQGQGLKLPDRAPAPPNTIGPTPGPSNPAEPLPDWIRQPSRPADPVSPAKSSVSGKLDRIAVIVNTDVITANEINARMRLVETDLRRRNVAPPSSEELERQIREAIIVERAQAQLARETGVRIDDATVDRAFARIAEDNKLTIEQFRDRLDRDGIGINELRNQIRREIIAQRLREREVDARLQVSDAEIDAYLAEQGVSGAAAQDEFLIGQILLRVPENATAGDVERQRLRAEELIKQLQRGADFTRLAQAFSESSDAPSGGSLGWRTAERLPSAFAEVVVPLKPGAIAPPVRSQNGFHVLKLLDRRSSSGLKMSGPVNQTKVRHILIRPNEIVSDTEARRRLTEIRSRVEGGQADFGDMARQYSSDGSAGRGGDLGWVYPGDTVPEFERAMNALQPGQMSEPVQSPFGLHLIQVLERRTDEASPDRIRQAARNAIRERKSDEAFMDWLRELRDKTFVEVRAE